MGVINTSFECGACPVDFKNAVVTPILKKSTLDPAQYKNYRPVSGLSFVSKVVERLVSIRLKQHIQATTSWTIINLHTGPVIALKLDY